MVCLRLHCAHEGNCSGRGASMAGGGGGGGIAAAAAAAAAALPFRLAPGSGRLTTVRQPGRAGASGIRGSSRGGGGPGGPGGGPGGGMSSSGRYFLVGVVGQPGGKIDYQGRIESPLDASLGSTRRLRCVWL
jgi:hypothetical protein